MRPSRRFGGVAALLLGSLIAGRFVLAQSTQPTREESALLNALAVNPVTSPYQFETAMSAGRVQLSGRVGTKVVYDEAVRIAIALGIPFDERLVIDTAATLRAAAGAAGSRPGLPGAGGAPVSTMPPQQPAYSQAGAVPYLYPQPLFGYYDDPFYGFEPPIIAYPPFWGALSRARFADPSATTPLSAGPVPRQSIKTERTIRIPAASGREEGKVEMSIDPLGNAVVRGVVPSDADRAEVEATLSRLPGVRTFKNEVEVRSPEEPPPPPAPAFPDDSDEQRPEEAMDSTPSADADPPKGAIDPDAALVDRLRKSLANRPALAGLPIRTTLVDGVATVSGKVPSIFEAMVAFRAVQKAPGVQRVVDHLEFAVPPPNGKNPLIERGRPDDIEPYLEAQIQRQLGQSANVDRVRMHGEQLDIRGTIASEADQPRVDATLRSMPALRGFQVVAEFLPD
jgi:osmotically-inducible protein OsmY